MVSDKRIDEKDLQTDIVVIGAGGAGLAAAVAAAEKGAKVILLEKRNALGGRSARAEGFFAAESPAQERLGIDAPKDILFKMAMDYAHWEINPRIVRAFINKSGDTVRWLEEKGMEIALVSPFYRNQVIRTTSTERGG
jgi:fumarate reductase flavoprotein subunit